MRGARTMSMQKPKRKKMRLLSFAQPKVENPGKQSEILTSLLPLAKKKSIVAFVFAVIFLSGCRISSESLEKASTEEKPALTQELFAKGQALYEKQCSVCHGAFGAADGKAAYLLYPKPRNFAVDKFRLVSTNNMEATDEDLYKVITGGMAGSAMPPWDHLAGKDRWALVYYVRYLSELENYKQSGEGTDEMIAKGLPWELKEKMTRKIISPENLIQVPPEPEVTEDALARGKELFLSSCAGCHGKLGKGDSQQEMKDNLGYPLRARDLTAGIFKGSSSSKDLYCRMVGGIPGTPMPSYTGVFTQEQIWDLIHYSQSLSNKDAEERVRLRAQKLIVAKTTGALDADPSSPIWQSAKSASIALTPLWWRDDYIKEVEVKALYNKDKIAFHLSWSDATLNDANVAIQSFSDGAALQFSVEKDPPFFGMGDNQAAVYLWHWKAAWQDADGRKDIETQYPNAAVDWYSAQKDYRHGDSFEVSQSKTKFHDPAFVTGWGAGNPLSNPENSSAAEEAISKGFSSLTTQMPKMEKIDAKGVWQDGRWQVVFIRSLNAQEKDALTFLSGKSLSIAFALWDGNGKDRNGQKMVSIWNTLILR